MGQWNNQVSRRGDFLKRISRYCTKNNTSLTFVLQYTSFEKSRTATWRIQPSEENLFFLSCLVNVIDGGIVPRRQAFVMLPLMNLPISNFVHGEECTLMAPSWGRWDGLFHTSVRNILFFIDERIFNAEITFLNILILPTVLYFRFFFSFYGKSLITHFLNI